MYSLIDFIVQLPAFVKVVVLLGAGVFIWASLTRY